MSRTLSVASPAIPLANGEPTLVPTVVRGRDGLNQLHQYDITLITPDTVNPEHFLAANASLDDFIGKPLTLTIELDDGGPREITGLITDAHFLRQEGRHVLYQLTTRPWLHLATLTSDCKIFQDQTVLQILEVLLADYAFPHTLRTSQTYPVRDYQVQYNETDYAFFQRLCQEWGLNFYFEYKGGAQTLIITDMLAGHVPCPGSMYQTLDYNPGQHKVGEEHIAEFSVGHRIISGAYATREYDYTRSDADLSSQRSEARPTAQATQEIYEWHAGAHYVQPEAGPDQKRNNPQGEGADLTLLRMDGQHGQARRAYGVGSLKGMLPGYLFTLKNHPQSSANSEYLILSTDFEMAEVSQESQAGGEGQDFKVEVRFEAYPTQGTPYFRPPLTQQKPHIYGPHSARVVGPAGVPIFTDSYGRVKVQFHWDRYGKRDANSSCWVRVASPFSGNQMGMMNLPRIGQEVLIEFIGGDPDLPVCTAQVHNQFNMPAWRLPEQLALSGFRSRELLPSDGNSAGSRSNHLILDDTNGQIQTQLKSDHDHSQLSLGHISRVEDVAGRKDPRGQGFELRTDGHGAVRATQGLLITTESRPAARAHITDMGETTERLKQAQTQHQAQADTAKEYAALDGDIDQSPVADILKAQNDSIKGSGGDPSKGDFPELTAPHLVLASPVGIETTTPGTTHIASGDHIALTSGGHTSLAVGKSLMASVVDAVRLFAYKAGMKLISASADIDIQALKTNINLLAKLDITQTANKITLTAKEEILLNGAGSYIKLNASGIEQGTKGTWVAHAASHSMPGPAGKSAKLPPEPKPGKGNLDLFNHYGTNSAALEGAPYEVTDALGKVVKGAFDASGKSTASGLFPGPAKVMFGDDPRNPWDKPSYFGKPDWPAQMPTPKPDAGDASLGKLLDLPGTAKQAASMAPSKLAALAQSAAKLPAALTQSPVAALASVATGAASSKLAAALPGGAAAALGQLAGGADLAKAALPAGMPALDKLPGALPAPKLPTPHL